MEGRMETGTRRQKQVENLLQKDLDEIIRKEVSDPKIGFFTITYVRISRDLRNATVGVSVMGSPEEREESFEAIRNACGYIQHKLAKKTALRHTPELYFKLDEMPELKVEEILKEIRSEVDNEKHKEPN